MPLKFFAETDVDPGEFFTWREEGSEKIEVRVRRIPPAREKAIEFRHFGRKRRVTFSKGGARQDLDIQKQEDVNREKASYCLVETKGFELEVAGPGAADQIGRLLSEKFEPGQVVSLDGKWTDALKDAMFDGLLDLVGWLAEKVEKLSDRDQQEDEEALGN
ncbi:hypothetical protein LCGC14_3112080 [marine sediment metagenome]|uniref:Uncharacterized protein n=1 Tax=marine sediment metagenome TaxID=412755 RepID=A0A0F8YUQ3_9ZZZZ